MADGDGLDRKIGKYAEYFSVIAARHDGRKCPEIWVAFPVINYQFGLDHLVRKKLEREIEGCN